MILVRLRFLNFSVDYTYSMIFVGVFFNLKMFNIQNQNYLSKQACHIHKKVLGSEQKP